MTEAIFLIIRSKLLKSALIAKRMIVKMRALYSASLYFYLSSRGWFFCLLFISVVKWGRSTKIKQYFNFPQKVVDTRVACDGPEDASWCSFLRITVKMSILQWHNRSNLLKRKVNLFSITRRPINKLLCKQLVAQKGRNITTRLQACRTMLLLQWPNS